MKVTGHRIQQRIRELKAVLEVLNNQVREALKAYPGEQKDPVTIGNKVFSTELLLVKLQCAQDRYNELVKTEVDGFGKVTLGYAVKAVGPLGRIEKLWRSAASGEKPDRYSTRTNERSKDTEYARPTVTPEDALALQQDYSKRVSTMRNVIALMNTTEIEVSEIGLSGVDFG